jgi:hypothetical protein
MDKAPSPISTAESLGALAALQDWSSMAAGAFSANTIHTGWR